MSFNNSSTEVVGEHGAIRNDGTFEDYEIYTYSSKWVYYFHKQVLVIEHIGFWLLLSGCMVMGIGGNVLNIYVFAVRWKANMAFTFFLSCLAACHIAKCAICGPLLIYTTVQDVVHENLPNVSCIFLRICFVFFTLITSFILILLAVDRCRQVYRPSRIPHMYHNWTSSAVVFVSATLLSLPSAALYEADPEADRFNLSTLWQPGTASSRLCTIRSRYRKTWHATSFVFMIIVVFSVAILTLMVACTLHCCHLRRSPKQRKSRGKHFPMPLDDGTTVSNSFNSSRPFEWAVMSDLAEMSETEETNVANNASESEDPMDVTTFDAANPNSQRNRSCVVDHVLCDFRATGACERVSGRTGSKRIRSNEALVVFPSGGDSFTQTSNKTSLLPPFRRQADKRPTRCGVKQRLTRCGVKQRLTRCGVRQRLTISDDRSNNADDKIDDTPRAETDEINQPTSSSPVSKQTPHLQVETLDTKETGPSSQMMGPCEMFNRNKSFLAFVQSLRKESRTEAPFTASLANAENTGAVDLWESGGTDVGDQKTNTTIAATAEGRGSCEQYEMNENGAFQSVLQDEDINPGVDPTTVTEDNSQKTLVERVLFTIKQSPGDINPGVDPTTVTEDSSQKTLVERVLSTIKVFENAQDNTAKIDNNAQDNSAEIDNNAQDNSAETDKQPVLLTTVPDEQAHAGIDSTLFSITVNDKKSFSSFVQRVVYMKVFEMALGNTDRTDGQLPEAVPQSVFPTTVTDEQFVPTTETDENSHSALIQRLLAIIMNSRTEKEYLEDNVDVKGQLKRVPSVAENMEEIIYDLKEAFRKELNDSIIKTEDYKVVVPRVEDLFKRSKGRVAQDYEQTRSFKLECRGIMPFSRTLLSYAALIVTALLSYCSVIIHLSNDSPFHSYLTKNEHGLFFYRLTEISFFISDVAHPFIWGFLNYSYRHEVRLLLRFWKKRLLCRG